MKDQKRKWTCPSCGRNNPPEANFCGSCGTARASEIIKKGDSRKNPLPLVLAFVLLIAAGILFVSAAVGEKPALLETGTNVKLSVKEIADVIPFPADYGESLALIALYKDGSVRTNGLETNFDFTAIQKIEKWSNIKQIITYQNGIVGLKADGSVVGITRSNSSPLASEVWTNVRALYTTYLDFFALTEDGRVLVPAGSKQSDFEGAVEDYLSWRDVIDLCPYSYPESRGVIGLKSDGNICAPGTFGVVYFPEKLKDVKHLSSSGYLTVCLQGNGTAKVCGMYAGEISQKLEKLNNIAQVEAREHGVVCRLKDGSVCYVHSNGAEDSISNAVEQWRDVTDVQAAGPLVLGLTRGGKVLLAMESRENSYYDKTQLTEIRQKLSSWDSIVKYKAYQCYGYLYILGWQKDGKTLAAGVDLAWVS